jgi:hypothetical protein
MNWMVIWHNCSERYKIILEKKQKTSTEAREQTTTVHPGEYATTAIRDWIAIQF